MNKLSEAADKVREISGKATSATAEAERLAGEAREAANKARAAAGKAKAAAAKAAEWTAAAKAWLRRAATFATRDVWDVEVSALRGLHRFLVRFVRTVYLVARGFKRNEVALRASSLTFVTMLSIVPVLALALSLAKVATDGDSLRHYVKKQVHELIFASAALPMPEIPGAPATDATTEDTEAPAAEGETEEHGEDGEVLAVDGGTTEHTEDTENPAAGGEFSGVASSPSEPNPEAAILEPASSARSADQPAAAGVARGPATPSQAAEQGVITEDTLLELIDKGFNIVEQLNFGTLGGIGLLMLVWTVISVIGNVEQAFNRVWGVAETRPFFRKVTDYLAVVIILPFLAVAASSVPVLAVLEKKMTSFDAAVGLSRFAGFPVFRVLWVLVILSLAFCFVLRGAPNTHVRFRPALAGGFLAAIGFSVWLKLCLKLQIGVAKYSQFFGTFAAVPILLFWVYVSWMILLVAAEVSFALQNADTYHLESGWTAPSQRARTLFAAALLRDLAHDMKEGGGPLDLVAWNRKHRVSVRLVRDVAATLVRAKILAPVDGRHDVYAALVDLQSWTLGDLVRALASDGASAEELAVDDLPAAAAARARLDAIPDDWPALRDLPA
ncbi:MAG: YihY family inner membrane protein [Kiritimatiellae bacterium]|nr:YihY family inner membrane protein [Kiritimatiellia bacterium]